MKTCLHRQRGMTLIELLTVMVIIGVGLTVFMPRLNPADYGAADSDIARANDALAEARDRALRESRTQTFILGLNKKIMAYEDSELSLPGVLSRATINGERPEGLNYVFRVYPSGVMDRLDLRFSGGSRWTVDSAGGRFSEQAR